MYKTDSLEEPRIALLREHEVVHEYQLRDDLSAQTVAGLRRDLPRCRKNPLRGSGSRGHGEDMLHQREQNRHLALPVLPQLQHIDIQYVLVLDDRAQNPYFGADSIYERHERP